FLRTLLTSWLINLIKNPIVREEPFLRRGPSTKLRIRYLEHRQRRELLRILCRDGCVCWPVEVSCDNFLSLRGIEILQVGFGHVGSAMTTIHLVDPCDRRFCQNAYRRHHDFKLIAARLLDRHLCFVFPTYKHITYLSLHKGSRCAARS